MGSAATPAAASAHEIAEHIIEDIGKRPRATCAAKAAEPPDPIR